MTENVAHVVWQAAERIRVDALGYRPGGWDEAWRLAVSQAWHQCATDMELFGAREVPFIAQQGVDPDAKIVINNSGHGNALWTATLAAARAYMKEH